MKEELALQQKESEEKYRSYKQRLQEAQEILTQQTAQSEEMQTEIKNLEDEKNRIKTELDKATQDLQGQYEEITKAIEKKIEKKYESCICEIENHMAMLEQELVSNLQYHSLLSYRILACSVGLSQLC